MKLLFVKGNEGLIANMDGKFYFPNRKSEIKEEGFYECEVTIDKEKYLFVKGKKLNTNMPDDEYLKDKFKYLIQDQYASRRIAAFYIKTIGNDIALFIPYQSMEYIGYINDDNVFEQVCVCKDVENNRDIYKPTKFKNHSDYDFLKAKSMLSNLEMIDEDKIKISIAAVISMITNFLRSTMKNIKIYNNKIIAIEYCTSHSIHAYTIRHYYAIRTDANNNIITSLDDSISEILNDASSFEISPSDIISWMCENHIGVGGVSNIMKKNISIMGTTIDVLYFNGRGILNGISEKDKEIVDKSFLELEAFKKKIGKNITKSNIHELQKLSAKNILGLGGY